MSFVFVVELKATRKSKREHLQ